MATARNPVTNDLIKSKTSSDSFDRNFDQIDWSVKLDTEKDPTVVLVRPEGLNVEKIIEEVITDHGDLLKELKD